MKQKGFATILSLCLILVVALIVKGIAEAETNHAREISNFEMEQALQNAAESGIYEAAELVNGKTFTPGKIFTTTKTFKHGEQTIKITVEVWGERGKIYLFPKSRTIERVYSKDAYPGIYFMSLAKIKNGIWDEEIYRRAYANVLSEEDGDNFKDDTTINFMELPTKGNSYVTRYN